MYAREVNGGERARAHARDAPRGDDIRAIKTVKRPKLTLTRARARARCTRSSGESEFALLSIPRGGTRHRRRLFARYSRRISTEKNDIYT